MKPFVWCITEYDEKETLALEREEGREEGLKIGREEGRIDALKTAARYLYNQGYPIEKIASTLDVSIVDVKTWLNEKE
ncbi:MAG: hypothetical protein J6X44_03310 [Thermoguttaceae bacterium]|nr:hypothetical protein [Thermoguttaceae bacterium]